MNETNKKIIGTLNGLIAICKDGKKGFTLASEDTKDAEFKALCSQYAMQRGKFAAELREAVTMLGGTPQDSGTVAGDLHRGWIGLKAAVTRDDEDAIIAECERGEDAAKNAYEKALNEYLPSEVTTLVQRQYSQVKEAHDRFSAMQKATR